MLDIEKTNELLTEYQTTADKLRQEEIFEILLKDNDGMLKELSIKYSEKNILDKDDLYQEACFAFLKAMEKFKLDKKVKFQTFAYKVIENALIREIKKENEIIRIPEYIQNELNKILTVEQDYYKKNGKYPKEEEVAKILDTTVERVKEVKSYFISVNCVDNHDESNMTLSEFIETHQNNPEEEGLKQDKTEALNNVLDSLNEREKAIIMSYYGYNSEKLSIKELSDKYKVSTERIRQIINHAKRQIKMLMEEDDEN